MTGTPTVLTGPPKHPESADLLTEVLRTIRLTSAVLWRADNSEPWRIYTANAAAVARWVGLEGKHLVLFHVVAHGQCRVELDGERHDLEAGDLIILPRGDAHRLGGLEPCEAVDVESLPLPLPLTGTPVIRYGGGGTKSRLICGFLSCEAVRFNPVLDGLPSLMVVRRSDVAASDWLRASTQRLIAECGEGRMPGSSGLCERLIETMFVEAVRGAINRAEGGPAGWLAAVNDRWVGEALRLMHAEPAKSWTVESLARAVGLSRSALGSRFSEMVGSAPMQYLRRWRLQLASTRLTESDAALCRVAEEVGYESEEAFSRAFKREFGRPPASWRREALAHA